MVCSNCKQEGHTKATCSQPKTTNVSKAVELVDSSIPITLPTEVRDKLTKLTTLCLEVAGGLGKGHVEAHYQQALCVELQEAGVRYVAEEVMPIMYKGRPLGGTCNARLDVMLHSFLPFIYELKAIPSRIGPIHHWQLVRYMTHKDIPYGAVVNFNQSEKGPLEVQFIVRAEGRHWLYDPASQTGRPLVDFDMSLATSPVQKQTSPGTSVATEIEVDLNWSEDE